jgi:hypothetical protein
MVRRDCRAGVLLRGEPFREHDVDLHVGTMLLDLINVRITIDRLITESVAD